MKRFWMAAMMLMVIILMAGCSCRHQWSEANCLDAKRCRICGQKEGEALGHSYEAATCQSPKTCTLCGQKEGEPAEHSWQAATCHAPETCTTCGITRGDALEHQWQSATCTRPELCILCKETRGEPGSHAWTEPTCVNPKYCTICAAIGSGPLGHNWIPATCDTPKTCSVCAATEGDAVNHSWKKATCTDAQVCRLCGQQGEPALGHSWQDPTCVLPYCCGYCDATKGDALGHHWEPATPENPKTCTVCAATEGLPIEMDDRFVEELCQPLFGGWQYTQTTKAEELLIPGFDRDVVEIITYEFGQYGVLYISTVVEDPECYKALLVGYRAAEIYSSLAEEGLDAEAADLYYVSVYDMNVVEYVQWQMESEDWESKMNLRDEWVYYVEDGVLYMAQHWEDSFENWSFALEGNLTMTNEEKRESLILTPASAEEA